MKAYVDGSFFAEGRFAGSGVYFGPDSPLNLVQYLPDNKYGEKTALLAEIYASVLAARQAYLAGFSCLVIKQDCKEAIQMLEKAKLCTQDLLLQEFLKTRKYIDVRFEWIKSHQGLADADENVLGNHEADRMAKLAANLTRYRSAVEEMDSKNPLLKPFPFKRPHVENLQGWLKENPNLDGLEQLENRSELVAAIPRDMLLGMWSDDGIRIRLLAAHNCRTTLFPSL